MRTEIKKYYALKTFETKRFFWSKPKSITKVVGETEASNWMWAELHLASVDYDTLVVVA